jgi:hypothetical protein
METKNLKYFALEKTKTARAIYVCNALTQQVVVFLREKQTAFPRKKVCWFLKVHNIININNNNKNNKWVV